MLKKLLEETRSQKKEKQADVPYTSEFLREAEEAEATFGFECHEGCDAIHESRCTALPTPTPTEFSEHLDVDGAWMKHCKEKEEKKVLDHVHGNLDFFRQESDIFVEKEVIKMKDLIALRLDYLRSRGKLLNYQGYERRTVKVGNNGR